MPGKHDELAQALARARDLARLARDEEAKRAYLDILRDDPQNFSALNELGTLALSGGFRSAARTAYSQAVRFHPDNAIGRINLANVLRADGDFAGAREQYEAALHLDPDLPEAHEGMAWVLSELDQAGAEEHLRRGFESRALVTKPYRGVGDAPAVLLLVAARGGNIPTQLWVDDRDYTVHALFADFFDTARPLPAHSVVVNAIGDADQCAPALIQAEKLLAQHTVPVINQPARVLATGRVENAARLRGIGNLITPAIERRSPAALLADRDLHFPLLLRRPGFHTGRHFVRVDEPADLAQAVAALAAPEVLAIQYLDSRGADGMARKYRVMFIDGVAYPLHLAISRDWKVHYFSANMADSAAFRAEEQRFLADMPGVLGVPAMRALEAVCAALGLDYAGIDFGLNADGAVLFFEANATMVVFPPDPDPRWDYRRDAIDAVLAASKRLVRDRL